MNASAGLPARACVMLFALGAACATLSCNAQVKEFTAAPRHICAGERVALHWSVVGSAVLVARPPSAGVADGPVADEGSATISPTTTTSVDLRVTRFLGSPTTSTQEIVVKTPDDKAEWLTASVGDPNAAPGCAGDKVWATVHANRFAADVKVAPVSAHAGARRTYEVPHAGVRSPVAPGAPSTAFAGLPIGGDWLLTATLDPSQRCGTPGVPSNVVVDVVTQCAAGEAR